jgi:hypothetical protein
MKREEKQNSCRDTVRGNQIINTLLGGKKKKMMMMKMK